MTIQKCMTMEDKKTDRERGKQIQVNSEMDVLT